MGYWRFRLKNYWAGMEFVFISLFKEIAERLNVNMGTLMWAYNTIDVKNALLDNKPLTKTEENIRKKSYTFILRNGVLKFLTGKDEENFLNEYIRVENKNIRE